jgi:hypothetical protein
MIPCSRARLRNETDFHAADIRETSCFQHLGDFVRALVHGRCATHGHDGKLMMGPQAQFTYEVICGAFAAHGLLTDEAVCPVRQDLHNHSRI